jgi:hypothetical protein
MVGQADIPTLTFDRLLAISSHVVEAEIISWTEIDRIDLRPKKRNCKS